jgi:hypothetical protein
VGTSHILVFACTAGPLQQTGHNQSRRYRSDNRPEVKASFSPRNREPLDLPGLNSTHRQRDHAEVDQTGVLVSRESTAD